MIDARNDLADAQEREADAAKELADARRNEAEVAEDNAKRIRDALQGVADAQDRLRDAHKGTAKAADAAATAQDKFAEAMKKLGPEQQEFVHRILNMRGAFQKFRNAVAEPLFKGLNDSLDILKGSGFTDVIQKGLAGTARQLGEVAKQGATLAASPAFQKNLGDAMGSNNKAIRNFGSAGVHLADALVSVADAAGPLFVKFSKWVDTLTKGWAETARTNNQTGKLRDTIETAGDRVSEFWGLAKQLWRTLTILGKAANTASNNFGDVGREGDENKDKFGYIKTLSDSLEKFNDKLDKNKGLSGRFHQALLNMNAAAGAAKTVFKPFIDFGANKNIEVAFDKIADSTAFDRMGKSAGDALPELADVLVNVTDFIAALSESGSVDVFLTIITKVSGAMADIAGYMADTTLSEFVGDINGILPGFIQDAAKWIGKFFGHLTDVEQFRTFADLMGDLGDNIADIAPPAGPGPVQVRQGPGRRERLPAQDRRSGHRRRLRVPHPVEGLQDRGLPVRRHVQGGPEPQEEHRWHPCGSRQGVRCAEADRAATPSRAS